MRVRAAINGIDVSQFVYVEALTIHQDSTEAISTCQLQVVQQFGTARYDFAYYDQSTYSYDFSVIEWQELVLWDQDTNRLLFAGYVLSVQRTLDGPHVRIDIQASDWAILFERTIITQSWPNGTPDSTIVNDLLAYVPSIHAGTIVTIHNQLGVIEAKDKRIRDVLDDVCALTGGEWAVSYDGKLNYYAAGSIVAPFALSDVPNGTTKMPYQIEGYKRDFSEAANRIVVLGAIGSTGELRATANDTASQGQYGILSGTVVDRNIGDAVTASLLAQSEVARRAYPKVEFTANLFVGGLTRGMTVAVESVKYGLNQSLLLRSIDVTILAPDRERAGGAGHRIKYAAGLGTRPPDLVYMLRRLQRRTLDQTQMAAAPIAPGSIDINDFATGIQPIQVVSALPPLPDPNYSATAVILWYTAPGGPQLYRRTGNTWTDYIDADAIAGQIQTPQLAPGSVTTTVLADGSVVTAKIPAGAIQAPQLAASSVTANAIAANAVYSEAIQANAVVAGKIAANAVTAGTIAALAVLAGNIAADAVTAGTIAAGAVIAGKIAADAVTTNTIKAGNVTSDKLAVNELSVGYGGNKPGKIVLYDTANAVAGVFGEMTQAGYAGQYGIWTRLMSFGGTGYNNAPIYTDTAGNLYLRNANVQVTGSDGTTIKTNPANFDPVYNTLALQATKTGDSSASLISRGLVVYDYSATKITGALVRNPNDAVTAEMVLYDSASQISVHCEGNHGWVRAKSFNVIGQTSFTGQVPAGRAINVVSGLITGYI